MVSTMTYPKGPRASINSTAKAADEESWTCKLCAVVFQDKKAELLECEYCVGHLCRSYLNLTPAEYKFLGKRNDFHWYCQPCQEKVAKNIKIEKEIEERCKNHVAMYEDRLNKLEEAIAKKPDIEKVKSMIDNNKTDETTGAKAAESEKQAIDALEEYKESIARRNNVMVFHVDESKESETKERKEADKPRPLKLVFEDDKSKGKFMGSLNKLEKAEPKYNKITVVHDLTQKEKQRNKEKWGECKEKIKELESGGLHIQIHNEGPTLGQKGGKDQKVEGCHKKKNDIVHVHRTNVFNQHNVNSSKLKAFKGLNCFYANADSLPNKLYELKGRVQEATDGFDIIGSTEIYPKKCRFLPSKAELQLEGFDLFLSEVDEHKRGVAVYINGQLKTEEIKLVSNYQENVWIKLKLKGSD
jgi:hypothetical protein